MPCLIAGPLHDLGVRLGLVGREPARTVALGVALGVVLWGVLLLLAAVEGVLDRLLVLPFVAGHVRIIVALPLILACEGMVQATLEPFVRGLFAGGILRGVPAADLAAACGRFNRLASSRLAEALLLGLAFAPSLLSVPIGGVGVTTVQAAADAEIPLSGLWYWHVCLPVFRFVLLRAVFRLGVWYVLMWRLSRLDLTLIPTHPDRVAGLRLIADVQGNYLLFTGAVNAVVAAAIAEEMASHGGRLHDHYATILVTLLCCAAAFILPLYVFVGRLWQVRLRGRAEYGDLASEYVSGFDAKWLRGGNPAEEPLLGSADLQSLADLGNSYRAVEEMQIAPITGELLKQHALAGLLPMLPLLLFEFPLDEILGRIIEKLVGA